MLELEVDGVKISELSTNFLDVPVAELAHAAVIAAQQILVEIKYRHREGVGQLLFEAAGVGGDAAQLVVGRDQGEPRPRTAADRTKGPVEGGGGKELGARCFELYRRHDLSLRPRAGPKSPAARLPRLWISPATLEVVPHRTDRQAADRPGGEGDQKDDADRTQAARVQRLLGQLRLDEVSDIEVLAVGIHARAVERLERVPIRGFGEAALAFELLVRAHDP